MAKVDAASFELDGNVYRYIALGSSPPDIPALTQAECEVVAMVCEGCANGAVAKRRRTSVHTVNNQLAAVFNKLKVSSRLELVEFVSRVSSR